MSAQGLETRIAEIVVMKGLTPIEAAAKIMTLPELQLRQIRVAVCAAIATKRVIGADGGGHARHRS